MGFVTIERQAAERRLDATYGKGDRRAAGGRGRRGCESGRSRTPSGPRVNRTGCTETSHRETLVPQGSYTLKLSPPKPMQHHLRWLGSDGARRSKAILVATLHPVRGFI